MIIGIPKEIKTAEKRVALTPAGTEVLTGRGHQVLVERTAGIGSGYNDDEYVKSGAVIFPDSQSIFARADLIVKVKEPLPVETTMLKEGQVLFTYLHLAASRQLTLDLLRQGVVAIAYETIQLQNGSLPLLWPMSMIAGRMAPQEGAKYLEEIYGGRGVLLAGVPGVAPAQVVVLGAGTVGVNATRIAAGMGASVTLLDVDPQRLMAADTHFQGRVTTMIADTSNVRKAVAYADVVIGAVLVPGAPAPRLITREMLVGMKKGSVLVDVAIDQGGCAETSRPTTHEDPVYVEEGVVHYTVANMPGAVPRTATQALTLNTLPYIVKIADQGWHRAASRDQALSRGVNLASGHITYKAVADAFNLPYSSITDLLS